MRKLRRLSILALLVSILISGLVLPGHATTYIGYGAANLGTNTCGTNCEGNTNINSGSGEIVQAPFSGQLTAIGFFTGSSVPNEVAVLTGGSTLASTNYNCGNAGTCNFANNGQAFTLQDLEGLGGLAGSTFFTVNLASPVTVSQNQFVAMVFLRTTDTNAILMLVGTLGQVSTSDVCFGFGSTNPTIGNAFNTGSGACTVGGAAIVGGSFLPVGQTGTTVTTTTCYGNCGNPPITLANTNSTHLTNFNQSVTLLYEFQSNTNGFVLNVTTNVAKSYANTAQILSVGIYAIASCAQGRLPFSNDCPGLLTRQASFQSPSKGQAPLILGTGSLPVSNGQWMGVSVTATFTGMDLNDTNTNVFQLFLASGSNPPSITSSTGLGNSKVGIWAWIKGNVVSGGQPSSPPLGYCAFLDCLFTQLVNSFCSNVTASCQTGGALFWAVILTLISVGVGGSSMARIVPANKVPIGEMFLMFFLIYIFIFQALALLFIWVPIFFFFVISLLMGKHTRQLGL